MTFIFIIVLTFRLRFAINKSKPIRFDSPIYKAKRRQ